MGNEEILDLLFFKQFQRITVITGAGTILANGILTTTICSEYDLNEEPIK